MQAVTLRVRMQDAYARDEQVHTHQWWVHCQRDRTPNIMNGSMYMPDAQSEADTHEPQGSCLSVVRAYYGHLYIYIYTYTYYTYLYKA